MLFFAEGCLLFLMCNHISFSYVLKLVNAEGIIIKNPFPHFLECMPIWVNLFLNSLFLNS